jgi:hypothetical protein
MFNKSITGCNPIRLFILVLFSVMLIACGGGGEAKTSSKSSSQHSNSNDFEKTEEQIVTISSNPRTQSVDENQLVTFSISASGGDLVYQWRKDGQSILGATQSTLIIASASVSDYGVYDVVVSNSESSATSLSALLTIQADVKFSVSLAWDIPQQREDGSDLALYEIDGYIVIYGTDAQHLDSTINISGGQETRYVIENLSANTYYFAIATLDSTGVRGAYSELMKQSVL